MERLIGFAPEHICSLMTEDCNGSVEMVNSRGIYLCLGGRHILLCHSRYGVVPNGIALDDWEQLPALLEPGQPVWTENAALQFSSGTLEFRSIQKDTRICVPNQKSVEAGVQYLLAGAKQTGLSSLGYPLFTGENRELNLYCRMALPHIRMLLQALREENTEGIFPCVGSLLGLGPGLTPSGDDWLSGLLYGLRHSSARDTAGCIALTEAIRELAPERTNAVSADYLYALTEDAPFARMAAAWEDPAAGAESLLQIGSNSGGEMLLGLLCAAELEIKKHSVPAECQN